MAINNELLSILACPVCKGDLVLAGQGDGLACYTCMLLYEIRNDIPIMLVNEARRLADVDPPRCSGGGTRRREES